MGVTLGLSRSCTVTTTVPSRGSDPSEGIGIRDLVEREYRLFYCNLLHLEIVGHPEVVQCLTHQGACRDTRQRNSSRLTDKRHGQAESPE